MSAGRWIDVSTLSGPGRRHAAMGLVHYVCARTIEREFVYDTGDLHTDTH